MPTKYLDTNLILRLIVKDNLEQLKLVEKLLQGSNQNICRLYTSVVVILECEWILRSFYKFEKVDIVSILQKILLISEIKFEQIEVINMALEQMLENNLGLEDNYHLAYCKLSKMELVTFDKKLGNKNFQKLQPQK